MTQIKSWRIHTKTAFMCVPVPEQTESICASPRNKGENGCLQGSKSLFYVLVSFMPLAVITLKSVCVCVLYVLYKYSANNKRQRKNVFVSSKLYCLSPT